MLRGIIVNGSPCVMAGGTLHRMPRTHQPVREWVEAVDVCPVCGDDVCDCITPAQMDALLARIDADPHGVNDPEDLKRLQIPF